MSGWLMGIAGAVVMTTLIDVLIAEGETKKYIKGIASILVLAAIVAPLPALLNKDFKVNYGEIETGEETKKNDAYLYRIYLEKYRSYELNLQNQLKAKGIDGVTIRINIAYDDGEVVILNVIADISAAVITSKDKNIDINKIIISTVSKGLNIDESLIIIAGTMTG